MTSLFNMLYTYDQICENKKCKANFSIEAFKAALIPLDKGSENLNDDEMPTTPRRHSHRPDNKVIRGDLPTAPRPARCAMPSASGIIPRFDFKQARSLLQKGKTPIEVIAAAERLGDDQLKQQIVMYVSSVRSIQAREVDGRFRHRQLHSSATPREPTPATEASPHSQCPR